MHIAELIITLNRYGNILKKQVDLLCDRFWTDAVRESLRPKIDSIARGEMPHASAALTLLLLKIPLSSYPVYPLEPKFTHKKEPTAPLTGKKSATYSSPPPPRISVTVT